MMVAQLALLFDAIAYENMRRNSMRKFKLLVGVLAALLVVSLVFTACGPTTSGDTEKTLTKIEVVTQPAKLVYEEGEFVDMSGIMVEAVYSDGTRADVTSSCTNSKGSDKLVASDTVYYVKYSEGSVLKTVGVSITVKGLSIETAEFVIAAGCYPSDIALSSKADYVFFTYYDSTSMKCNGSMELFMDDNDNIGQFIYTEQNGKAKLGAIEGTFVIEGTAINFTTTKISSISTTKYDDAKLETGTLIKKNGNIVGLFMGSMVTAEDTFFGWSKKNASDFVEGLGTKYDYEAYEVYLEIVTGNSIPSDCKLYYQTDTILSISIKQAPTAVQYIGQTLNTTGLEILVTKGDGSTQTITSGYTVDKTNPLTSADSNVTVTYQGKTATFSITVLPVPVDPVILKIEIVTQPAKTEYVEGDMLDLTGMKVEAVYSDSSRIDVTGSCTNSMSAAKLATSDSSVTISYESFTASLTITVKTLVPATADFVIAAGCYPSVIAEESKADLVFITYYDATSMKCNGTMELFKSNNNSETGRFIYTEQAATAKLGAIEGTYQIASGTSIEFTTAKISSIGTTKYANAKFETGTLIKNNNKIVGLNMGSMVTAEGALFGWSKSKASDFVDGLATQYGCNAYEVYLEIVENKVIPSDCVLYYRSISSISIKTEPTNPQYAGSLLDTTGLELLVTYSDQTAKTVTSGFSIDKTNPLTVADTSVTVTYEGKTASFNITVMPVVLTVSSISVKTAPTATQYIGSPLDMTGLELLVTYSDGSTRTVTTGFTVDKTGNLTVDDKTVIVTYEGKTTSFEITVVAATAELSSIAVTGAPETFYFAPDQEGAMTVAQHLSKSELVVTASYADGSSRQVTDYTIVEADDYITQADYSFTISYTENGITKTAIVAANCVYLTPLEVAKDSNADYVFVTNFTKDSNYVNCVLELNGTSSDGTFLFTAQNGNAKVITLKGAYAIAGSEISFTGLTLREVVGTSGMFVAQNETATIMFDESDSSKIVGLNFGSMATDKTTALAAFFGYSASKASTFKASLATAHKDADGNNYGNHIAYMEIVEDGAVTPNCTNYYEMTARNSVKFI